MTTATPQRSVMQFSLRGLVTIVTGVAIIMGILSPWIRSFEPGKQQRILTFFLIVTAGLIVGLLLACLSRYRVERRCGMRRCRIVHEYDSIFYQVIGGICVSLMLFTNGLNVFVSRPAEPVELYFLSRINCFLYGALSSGIVTWIWWRRGRCSAELCDNGLVFGFRFYSWSKFKYCVWSADRSTLSFKTKWGTLTFDVPEEHRAQVDRMLELHLHE